MSTTSDNNPIGNAPLRIGVMLDSLTVTAWEYKVLQDIASSGFAKLSVVVLNDGEAARLSRWDKLKLIWPNWIYSLYLKLDYRLTRRRVKHDAFAPVAAVPLLHNVKQVLAKPLRKKFTDRFTDDDVAAIRESNLDVMIRFGFRIIRGEILNTARYGVWSMHHGDNDLYRGGPAHFWEIYEGNPLTGVVLQVLSEELDAGKVIYRTWGRTNPHSLFLNRNAAYWKSADFYIRRLRQLHELGPGFLNDIGRALHSDRVYTRGIYRNPSNRAMICYLGKIAWRWSRGWLRRQWTREAWFIAWRRRDCEEIGIGHSPLNLFEAPKDRYYADPFLLEYSHTDWLIFEDYPYAKKRGVISGAAISPDGSSVGQAVPMLERPYHLSFPFLMKDDADGQLYMMPETRGNQCIERFRCEEFPGKWMPDAVVMAETSAADSVIFFHDGLWWMFTNIAVPGAAGDDELSLFHSSSASGPWAPHVLNPVVSDVRRARMAGNVFYMNGHLVRPAQDGSRGYGSGVVFHRITTLTRTSYEEVPFHWITDAGIKGNIGTHTYNRNERYEVIDGRFLKPKWR